MNETIDTAALVRLIEQDAPVLVLDVRPAAQRAEWHIPGSVHVDAYEALTRGDAGPLDALDVPGDRLVVTVCAAGRTSLVAAAHLRRRGVRAVSLAGGMRAWSAAANTALVPLPGTRARVVQVRRTGKGCLSYLVGSGSQAAVIDAALPPAYYRALADAEGWTITHVFDTHVHADHLSRSKALAEQVGARLLVPEPRRVRFDVDPVRDGDVFTVGSSRLAALATPGHTPESTTYVLDEAAVFTGDTLFVDGVGRPDLEASHGEALDRAGALYDALQRLFARVPDSAHVLPGHTNRPVPFDGQAVTATLDAVRRTVALLACTRDTFTERLLGRIPPTPPNYQQIVRLNEAGEMPLTDPLELEAGANRCAVS